MSWAALDAPLWKSRPLRGYRQDWERSRNLDGTVPTKEAHYWIGQDAGFAGACTVHPACGRLLLEYDGQHRLLQDATTPICEECSGWAAQRLLAGHSFERETPQPETSREEQ